MKRRRKYLFWRDVSQTQGWIQDMSVGFPGWRLFTEGVIDSSTGFILPPHAHNISPVHWKRHFLNFLSLFVFHKFLNTSKRATPEKASPIHKKKNGRTDKCHRVKSKWMMKIKYHHWYLSVYFLWYRFFCATYYMWVRDMCGFLFYLTM